MGGNQTRYKDVSQHEEPQTPNVDAMFQEQQEAYNNFIDHHGVITRNPETFEAHHLPAHMPNEYVDLTNTQSMDPSVLRTQIMHHYVHKPRSFIMDHKHVTPWTLDRYMSSHAVCSLNSSHPLHQAEREMASCRASTSMMVSIGYNVLTAHFHLLGLFRCMRKLSSAMRTHNFSPHAPIQDHYRAFCDMAQAYTVLYPMRGRAPSEHGVKLPKPSVVEATRQDLKLVVLDLRSAHGIPSTETHIEDYGRRRGEYTAAQLWHRRQLKHENVPHPITQGTADMMHLKVLPASLRA